ncbi:chaperone [Lithospermum erythrorhizon]|uniref:Chaperone n=1 Tax=Lithospermum erythrorhizon TaxID=34254 RepID=A0AAV3NIG6_LITER
MIVSQFSRAMICQVRKLVKGYPVHVKLNPNCIKSRPLAFKVRADVSTTGVEPPITRKSSHDDQLQKFLKIDYKWGFNQEIDSFSLPKGLSEETVRLISARKNEPDWMLEFRLKAFEKFLKMKKPNCLDEAAPKLVSYFDKLGVPLKALEKSGVIFCSISEAVREYPDLGKVISSDDNFYAALNSAVFSDGSFVFIPKNVKCPMPISTYFRINAMETGQFERTLIVSEESSFVEYSEGCSTPSYDTNQLHAAVVELYWRGGIYNFVTKRGLCAGTRSKISWTQVEIGAAITWKYPSVVLEGDESVGEFYSVAVINNYQQADTGTKMLHKGKNTRSRIISKGISAGHSRNCYRGLVQVMSGADGAKSSS